MQHDSKAAYDREDRLHEREAELVARITAIQRRAMEEIEPVSDELWRLRDHRDPKQVTLTDGRTFFFTGPRPDYQLPEERHVEAWFAYHDRAAVRQDRRSGDAE